MKNFLYLAFSSDTLVKIIFIPTKTSIDNRTTIATTLTALYQVEILFCKIAAEDSYVILFPS